MATFRRKRSRKYRNKNTRRKSRNARKSNIKRRGKKTLRGGGWLWISEAEKKKKAAAAAATREAVKAREAVEASMATQAYDDDKAGNYFIEKPIEKQPARMFPTMFPTMFYRKRQVAPAPPPIDRRPNETSPTYPVPALDPAPTSSLPLHKVSLVEDINKFSEKINSEMIRLAGIDTEQNDENLEMYIDAIIETSRLLTHEYYKLMLKINNSEHGDVLFIQKNLFKQKEDLLHNYITTLDSISRFKGIEPLNKIKDAANKIAINYYTGLSDLINSSVN